MNFLQWAEGFLSGRIFSNLLSLASFVLALYVYRMGRGLKAEHEKLDAIFGFHMHLPVYFGQLKKLTYSLHGPMCNLYLLGADNVRHLGAGYEKYAEDLSVLAQKMLDYLSSKPTQFPVVDSKGISVWNDLMEELIRYLLEFAGYKHNNFLPHLNSEDAVKKYCERFQEILQGIEELIM